MWYLLYNGFASIFIRHKTKVIVKTSLNRAREQSNEYGPETK